VGSAHNLQIPLGRGLGEEGLPALPAACCLPPAHWCLLPFSTRLRHSHTTWRVGIFLPDLRKCHIHYKFSTLRKFIPIL